MTDAKWQCILQTPHAISYIFTDSLHTGMEYRLPCTGKSHIHDTHTKWQCILQIPYAISYWVATISRLPKITGLFCKRVLSRDFILEKRPTILRSLLIVPTPCIFTDSLHTGMELRLPCAGKPHKYHTNRVSVYSTDTPCNFIPIH